MDHICGLPAEIIAIEPGSAYHESLRARGFKTYSFAADAVEHYKEAVEWVISFETIEHVGNPLAFLSEIVALLKPDGRVALSTPNRDDALLEIAGERYKQFYYRVHHRWYFDIDSLTACARLCGLELDRVHYVQRYGIANAITWIRDGRPSGESIIPAIDDPALDTAWRHRLESMGQSDWLYAIFKRTGT